MKWLIIGVVIIIVIAYFFIRYKHSTVSLRYKLVDNKVMKFSFKFHETDTISQAITFLTTTVKKHNGLPMFIQIGFKGQRKDAEKVLALKLKLYAKNISTGLYNEEIVINNNYAYNNFSFYESGVYGFGKKNYTEDLNKLIHLPNDYNKPEQINRLIIDHELILGKKYPKDVKAVITVKWIGGEQEFSTLLELKEYYPSGIRTNPFG